MSLSLYAYGFKPPDEKWKKMKAVYDACKAAGVDAPHEVGEFFNHEAPDDQGVRAELACSFHRAPKHPSTTFFRSGDYAGFEIDLSKLDSDIRVIRVVLG